MIDYATWAEKRGIKYSTFSTHQVRLTDILEIAKENHITFQKGDILFVRVGVTKEWDTVMTDAQKQAYSDNSSPEHAGVEATEDVLRWLWDSGFAAIASDAISWEVRYPKLRKHIPSAQMTGGNDDQGKSTDIWHRSTHHSPLISSSTSTCLQDGACRSVSYMNVIPFFPAELALKRPRGTFRPRSASTILRGTSTVDLLRHVRAIEYAWRSFIASQRYGNFLGHTRCEFATRDVNTRTRG